ncbi:MAG: Pyridoxine 5'-phosphate synthase [Owenweeksia sp. TMED14]|nr:MAG: Pyridoxine 5'-phosphate synthase [Owenweeksia sp. TMED14]
MIDKQARLSVNINKIATLRNARGGNIPDVLLASKYCEEFGAQGITVHPRPDERHIRYDDARALRNIVKTEFNIEGFPNKEFMDLVIECNPDQVTLVPDGPNILTSNAGWDTIDNFDFLKDVLKELKNNHIRSSIFIGCDKSMIESAGRLGADRVELYTEDYAKNFTLNKDEAVKPYVLAGNIARQNGLGINAGHDLNLDNLEFFAASLDGLQEVSIGHSIISDAIYLGLENTIQRYIYKLELAHINKIRRQ